MEIDGAQMCMNGREQYEGGNVFPFDRHLFYVHYTDTG